MTIAMDGDVRLLSPIEVGGVVKATRVTLRWTQETLAEISGLTTRTVQRVETGQPSSLDTRRALARAFRWEDLDAFSRPMAIPSEESLRKQKEDFERRYLVLPAEVVDGRRLVTMLMERTGHLAIYPNAATELQRGAQDAYAVIVDYLRDLMDVVDDMPMAEMLSYGDSMEEMLTALRAEGHCVCAAVRSTSITGKDWTNKTPLPLTIIYVMAAPLDQPARQLVVKKKLSHIL